MTTITTRDAPIDRTPTLTFYDSTEHHFYTFSELSLWYLYNRILGEDGSKHKALRVSLLKGFSTGLYRSTRTSTSKHPAFEDGCSSARKIVAVNTPTDKRSIISCAFWKGPCVYYPALEKKKKTQKNVWVMSSLWPSTPFFSCCILPGLPHLQELRASLTITHPQITGRARTQSVPLPVSFWWVLFELCPTIQTRDTHRDSRASLVCLSE